ncbi:MAG: phospholipase D-like domain-containing protein [Pseudomonadota bacterium]
MTSTKTTLGADLPAARHIPSAPSGAYPVRAGNRVRPLVDGGEIFTRIAEAIAEARRSVWLTVAFYSDDFQFPDGSRLFDVLDEAVARGLDVRLLCWRANPETRPSRRIFGGTQEQRALLAARKAGFRIRWDRGIGPYCQHQKSWVMDAGQPTETAFVGGINLTGVALRRHDVFVEITGPAACDVHHNFVQRWNGASERLLPDGNWRCDPEDMLPLPAAALESREKGASAVQIQRMMDPRRYAAGEAERSILDQYERAIDAARDAIYIENQAVPIAPLARRLAAAMERGVDVVMVVPPIPEHYVRESRADPAFCEMWQAVEALGRHPRFALCGIAERDGEGLRAAYVHAKLMLVDGAWATVGSCNLHPFSMGGQTELNAAIWDEAFVVGLRRTLFTKHLGIDTAGLSEREALRLFVERAQANRGRLDRLRGEWQGLAFALRPADYAVADPGLAP